MNVTIIGAGNVATQLALALRKSGHRIVEIVNRSTGAGEELAKAVGTTLTTNFKQLQQADVYLIAVKDDAIADVATQLQITNGILAHTSGTKTKDILKFSAPQYGIFYPLQTMTRSSFVNFSHVPLVVEGESEGTIATLKQLAQSLTPNVQILTEEQRQWLHIAAVFANNFTNHLYHLSESILKEKGLDFSILYPLIQRSVENLQHTSPALVQTGPAARRDMLTIEKHRQLLDDHRHLQKIYDTLTKSIIVHGK